GVGGFRTIATITVTAKAPAISAGSVKVTGTAKVGAILTAAPSSWPAGTTFRYSWSADGTVIAGEKAKTFVPTAGVVGKKITVRVTGSLAGYSSSSKTSAATNPVTKATLTSAPPTISGAAKVGSTLTAKAGTWTSGAALRYQWFAGAQPIAGATSATFLPKAAHVGSRLSVRVTGTLQGYVNKVETSAPTRPVTR
ncbi:metallophosphoesterase, partial [Microbacterium sp. CFBP 13617]|nr:metallophosphoesterase [Microbacterium sp. CFBP 13617]